MDRMTDIAEEIYGGDVIREILETAYYDKFYDDTIA